MHAYPPAIGGVETHVRALATQQAKLGHEVTVVTTNEPNAPAKEMRDGVNIRRYWALRFPFFSSIRMVPFLSLRLMRMGTDVYCSHAYGSIMPFCTALAAFASRKPFVFSLHGFPRMKGLGAVLQKCYKTFMASVFLRVAIRVISVGSASRKFVLDTVPESKITVVPNGVDTEKFRTRTGIDRNKSKTIIYVGRLDRDKCIKRLINAVSIANAKGAGLRVKIVGKDEGVKAGLEQQAKRLGVDASFVEVPYAKVQEQYEDALAFVLPSRYEGMSLVYMEAVSSERPAFSTLVGDVPDVAKEVYGNKARFFLFNTDAELADKLLEVHKKRGVYAAIMKKSRSMLKKKMSWEAVATRTIKVYKQALGESR